MNQYSFANTFDYQNYILSYLHPENPYRSMIICYKVGLGKTYASACLAYVYLIEGFNVLYLANSLNSISTFKLEYNKVIIDSRGINLSQNIEYMTFNKITKYKISDKYGLIIMDEIHNLRENANRYNKILNILNNLNNPKLLLMTATPMIDSDKELDSIIKLTGEENPKISFSYKDIDNDLKINYIGDKINNETLFISYMKGIQLEKYKSTLNESNNFIYINTRQASITCSNVYNKNIPLEEQSSKIYKLIKNLKSDKLTVIFCFYIDRGIEFLASVLESIGYSKWGHKNNNKKYAIIDGRNNLNQTEEILVNFNSISNFNGNKIHILIGSSVLSESITLYRVNELHILSPFWNYGQIEQSIGRAVRFGSHNGLEDKTLNIYLHAACCNKNKEGNDIDIWKIAYDKKIKIDKRLNKEISKNLINYDSVYKDNFIVPEVDNKLVFRVSNYIWDLRNCFDDNKFKISWCIIKLENLVGYNLTTKSKILGTEPSGLKINKPLNDGYTIWRSCIDNNLRISYINGKNNKFSKRGKIISNVKSNEINNISKDLNCDNNLESIIKVLKSQNRYFDKQIEYDIQ